MSHPTNLNLRDELAGLADEVRATDLRDRVRASSRRVTVRRRIVITSSALAAAVALVGGIAWSGVFALHPGYVEPAAPAGPATPRQGTAVRAYPSLPGAPPPGSASTPVPPSDLKVPNELFYLSREGGLQRLDGTTATPTVQPSGVSCGLTVSPDHAWIAYVTANGSGALGDLVVSGADGADPRTVLHGVACTGGNSPVWHPDAQEMLVQRGNTAPREAVDVFNGAISATPFSAVTGYLTWSPYGNYAAYADGDLIVVARADGTVVHRVRHGGLTPTGGFSVQGVSDDGRKVVLGMRNTDPYPIRTGFQLVDATTGQDVLLPAELKLTDPKQAAVYFSTAGGILVRVPSGNGHTLHMLTPSGSITDSRTEPAALGTATLITGR